VKGRPRDPTRAKRKTGHRRKPDEAPKLRAVPAPIERPPSLQPPLELPEEMRPTWEHVVEVLGGITSIRSGDAFAVELMVRQYHRVRQTGKLVDDYGVLARTEAGAVTASPFLKAERDATAMFLRLAEHFGLTVASRMRLGLMTLQGQTLAQSLAQDLAED
jgi:P27 family predicted phage terminase small subunit